MSGMEIRDQVRLGLGRCMEICLSGIRYRLFRSIVTVGIVALAVAFLTVMLGQSVIGRRVGETVAQQVRPRENYVGWLGRLERPLTGRQLDEILWKGESRRIEEVRHWGGLSEEELVELAGAAGEAKRYLDFVRGPDDGRRALLMGSAEANTQWFSDLQDEEAMEKFRRNQSEAMVPLPGGWESFERFVQRWNESRLLRQRVLAGHAQAVMLLAEQLAGRRAGEMLAEADEETVARLGELGFAMTEEERPELGRQARLERLGGRMMQLRSLPGVRRGMADRAGIPLADVSDAVLLQQTNTVEKARDVLEMASREARVELTAEELAEASQAQQRQMRLSQVQAKLAAEDGPVMLGFPPRTLWLIVVSFGVCAVGVANAMLMSVTERFREIATMKCLGAMDGFIMALFVLESALEGLVGAAVGAAIGLLLGLARGWGDYGGVVFVDVPWAELAACAGVSVAAGVGLAALAAVYPARVASRLAPMEAMRVE